MTESLTPQANESQSPVPPTFDALHEEFEQHKNRYPGDTVDQLIAICKEIPSLDNDAIKEQIKGCMLEFLKKQQDISIKYKGHGKISLCLYNNRKMYRNNIRTIIKDVVAKLPPEMTLPDVITKTLQELQAEMQRDY